MRRDGGLKAALQIKTENVLARGSPKAQHIFKYYNRTCYRCALQSQKSRNYRKVENHASKEKLMNGGEVMRLPETDYLMLHLL